MSFKVDDVIRRKDGCVFSHDGLTATIHRIGDDGRRWLRETHTYISDPDLYELVTANSQALKADTGKLQWSLVTRGCAKALLGIVKVMTIAVTPKPEGRGYAPDSWKLVPGAEKRYEDALFRHLSAIARGEVWDNGPEGTGQLHWDCVATNALFLSEFAHGVHDAPNNIPTA